MSRVLVIILVSFVVAAYAARRYWRADDEGQFTWGVVLGGFGGVGICFSLICGTILVSEHFHPEHKRVSVSDQSLAEQIAGVIEHRPYSRVCYIDIEANRPSVILFDDPTRTAVLITLRRINGRLVESGTMASRVWSDQERADDICNARW